MQVFNYLKSIKLSRLKVKEGAEYDTTQKQNIILSQLCILVIVIAIIHLVDDSFEMRAGGKNFIWLNLVEFLMIFVSLITYLLNENRKHKIAKHLFLFSFNILLFLLNTVAPKESGSYFFFFPLMAATFIFYGYSDEGKRYFYLGLTAALFIILTVFNFNIFGITVDMDTDYDFFTNLISSLILMALTISFLINLNKRSESHMLNNQLMMEKLVDDINDKNVNLEKVNRELDRFVYSVSHDLRAPLMSILGLINLSNLEDSVDKHKSYLQMMKEMVHKLDNFIHEVIDYTRNIKADVINKEIDIENIILEVINDLKFMDEFDRIDFKTEINIEEPFVADLSRVNTILNNLITNSIKYHNKAQPKPFIKIGVESKNDKRTLIISDNGSGIHEKYHAQVFDMFFRGTETSVGSGLGLYIVKEMVNKLSGSIKLESTLNEGTKFIISF
jgi:signal transduction histidine kinase